MAKNKHFFGKFLAFTATAAAVGGACYVFRDKIKNSPLYKATLDKACDLYDKWKYRDFDDDEDGFEDFAFDDDDSFDDVFSDEDKGSREYTSITINAKEDDTSDQEENTADSISDENTDSDTETADNSFTAEEPVSPAQDATSTEEPAAEPTVPAQDDASDSGNDTDSVIPIIHLSTPDTASASTEESASKEPEVLGYENEGLSDVSEDPDVLEEQDKLDF